jgi:TonB family protein
VVRSATNGIAYVLDDGKMVAANGNLYALKEVPEYFPVIVDVSGLNVGSTYLTVGGTASALNNELNFNATLVSPQRLDHVFIVLDMDTEGGKSVFLWGVGTLSSYEPRSIAIKVPAAFQVGSGHFKFHVFTDGVEVLNSTMGYLNIDGALDRMVRKRIADVRDAQITPFIYPAPEYPKQLKAAKVEGKAVVKVHVDEKGSVNDPSVKEASDPEFGRAALEAVRQWRFLPRMKDGQALETTVDVPFIFSLPKAS